MKRNKQHGFSLIEAMVVVCILFIMLAFTVISMQPFYKKNRVDAAYDTTLMAMRSYRSLAITQRKKYVVAFSSPPGTITISYQGVAASGPQPSPVVVNTYTLPSDVTFDVQSSFPNSVTTTPDGFGTGVTAIDFGQGLGLSSPLTSITFMPDGSAQDSLGNMNSGIIYMTRVGELYSSRAITIYGATGRIRGWYLAQVGTTPTWKQQ